MSGARSPSYGDPSTTSPSVHAARPNGRARSGAPSSRSFLAAAKDNVSNEEVKVKVFVLAVPAEFVLPPPYLLPAQVSACHAPRERLLPHSMPGSYSPARLSTPPSHSMSRDSPSTRYKLTAPFSAVCILVQPLTSIDFYHGSEWLWTVCTLQPIAPHLAWAGSPWLHAHQALTHIAFTTCSLRLSAC